MCPGSPRALPTAGPRDCCAAVADFRVAQHGEPEGARAGSS